MTTDHDGRGTTRLTADDRRLAILDNAELVFVKNGFQSTSTREIAEACGVTEPVLYRHFKGKEDLFLSVVARMFEDCLRVLERGERTGLEAEQAARIPKHCLAYDRRVERQDRLHDPMERHSRRLSPQIVEIELNPIWLQRQEG